MKKEHIKITPFFEIMKISGETKFSSVQFSQSCLTLRPHGLQHARLLCPSPTPGTCSNACPSGWCYHLLVLGETKNNLLKTDLRVEIQQWQTNAIILQRQPKPVECGACQWAYRYIYNIYIYILYIYNYINIYNYIIYINTHIFIF